MVNRDSDIISEWWRETESNRRRTGFQPVALPPELSRHFWKEYRLPSDNVNKEKVFKASKKSSLQNAEVTREDSHSSNNGTS